ncbi:MAG TPA: hypothetical protein VF318_06070, partial [Dehalococcoidales bacterium]
QTDGLKALIGRGVLHGFYERQIYYLYEHSMQDRAEANYKPKIKDFMFTIVSTKQEADKLISSGFNLHLNVTDARHRLDKGAIAFCVFIGQDLASIGFIATTQDAMDSLNQPPIKVNFSKGEVCTGGGWTNPKYRALGLATYLYFKRLQSLKDEGKVIARAAVLKDNIASHKTHARFAPRIWAEGHASRVLWHIFWKEIPFLK